MRIYVDGRDDCGWHMDVERRNIQRTLQRLGIKETTSLFLADIVHNIWWNHLLIKKKPIFKKKKNILVTSSNFVNLDDDKYALINDFASINKIAKAWISPSNKQIHIFDKHNVKSYYQPFYLDLSIFKPFKDANDKHELLNLFSIPLKLFKDKVVIGSFQRDSLGSNLKQPKWQKNPELLIDLLKELPKNNFILLLAGPRRHFVIDRCKKYNIPYYYIGREMSGDDLEINTLKIEQMPFLYYLTDIYLVTSVSEGGPKAVMEATATKTFILSTDVGLSPDFINKENIYNDMLNFKKRLFKLVENFDYHNDLIRKNVEEQYMRAIGILNSDVMDKRLLDIYSEIIKHSKY